MDALESQPVPTRCKSRWLQFSLRTLLVLPVVAGVGLIWPAIRMQRAWTQKEHVLAIRSIEGCQVAYDGEDVFQPTFSNKVPPLPPVTWTEGLFGKDFVHRAGTVGLPDTRVDEVVPHLQRLPYLRRVVVLKSDSSNDQVEAAAKRIEREVVGVETVMLEFDFNINARLAREGGGVVTRLAQVLFDELVVEFGQALPIYAIKFAFTFTL